MTTARSAWRSALVTALDPLEPAGVQVEGGLPGDELEKESVFLGRVRGPMTILVSQGLPATYDDHFTQELFVWAAAPGQTYVEAEARLSALWLPVEGLLRDYPTLGVGDAFRYVVAAEIGQVDGQVGQTREGFAGFIRAELNVHARITGTPQ